MKIQLTKNLFIILFFVALFTGSSFSQTTLLDLDGFTADVIANGTATAANSTTDGVDNGQFVYYEEGWNGNTDGLPTSGLVNSAITAGISYQMADYATNNSLRLPIGTNGTLNVQNTGVTAKSLYVLAVSGSGPSTMNVTITFSDNTTQIVNNINVADWYGGANVVLHVKRASLTDNTTNSLTSGPNLYQYTLSIDAANQNKTIQSISFSHTIGDGILNVFAVTASNLISFCTPSGSPSSDVITSFSLGTITNTTSTSSTVGYSDFTNQSTDLLEGTQYSATIHTGNGSGNHGLAVWIDWNDDGIFSSTEMVGSQSNVAANSTVTITFTVPAGAIGSHRLRVAYRYNLEGNLIDPCNISSYSSYFEAEDYTVNVITADGCYPPSVFSITSNGTCSMTINWSLPSGLSTENFDYEIRTSGAPGSGAVGLIQSGNTAVNSIDLTNLNIGTNYTIYVKSHCDDQSSSDWSSGYVFQYDEGYEPIALTGYNQDIIANGNVAPMASTTISVDKNNYSNPNGGGNNYVFFEENYAFNPPPAGQGLPANGIYDINGKKFQLADYSANNDLRLEGGSQTGTLMFATAMKATDVIILGTSSEGTSTFDAEILFDDNTTQALSNTSMSDWAVSTQTPFVPNLGRLQRQYNYYDNGNSNNIKLYEVYLAITPANQAKMITGVKFTTKSYSTGILNILAVSVKRAPVEVTLTTADTSVCPNTSVTLNGTIKNTTGNWEIVLDNGETITGNGDGNWSKVVQMDSVGTFAINVESAHDSVTCKNTLTDNPQAIEITVKPFVTPTFTNPGPICFGTSVVLPDSSTNGIIGSWSPAFDSSQTMTYTFTPVAPNASCGVDTTMEVIVKPKEDPTFDQIAPICFGTVVVLPDTSTNDIVGSWSPAFDNTQTTTYTFTPNDIQCINPVQMTVVVNPLNVPTFTNPGPICVGGTYSLPTTSLDNFTGTWSPAIDLSQTTTYTFTPDAGQTCVTTSTLTVVVNPLPNVTVDPDKSICEGASTSLTANGAFSYTWGNNLGNGNQKTITPTQTTTYTVVGTDLNGCQNSAQVTVTVKEGITADFEGDNLKACDQLTTHFTNLTTDPSYTYYWDFGDGQHSDEENPTYTFTGSGCYDVTLTIDDHLGCLATITKPNYACVYPTPIAGFFASTYAIDESNPTVDFTNSSKFATQYSWTFGDSTGTNEDENPSHTYSVDNYSSHLVILTAMNDLGCSDTAQVYIRTLTPDLAFIPNAFTPDGDEYNNVFKPVFTPGFDLNNYQLDIYDRWGELIFTTHEVNIGWDGTFSRTGQICQTGTYVWKLKIKLANSEEYFQKSGHVTLLK